MSRGSDILILIIHMRCLDQKFYLHARLWSISRKDCSVGIELRSLEQCLGNNARCKVPSKNMHIQKKLLATSLLHAVH